MTALTPAQKERQRAARSRAGHIRYGMQVIADTWIYIARARAEGDHLTLGYDTWEEYVDGEFGEHRVKLPAEKRAAAIAGLAAVGLTQRESAYTLGISQSTVRRTLAGPESNDSSDEDEGAGQPVVDALKQAIVDAGQRAEDHRVPPVPGDEDGSAPSDAAVEGPPASTAAPQDPGLAGPAEEADARPASSRASSGGPGPATPSAGPGSSPAATWTAEERAAHEEQVQLRKDVESARAYAPKLVTNVRGAVLTILTGYRLGVRDLVTAQQIAECRAVLDLLEKEVLADAQR